MGRAAIPIALLVVAACSSFGAASGVEGGGDAGAADASADGAGTCALPTCPRQVPSCKSYDFAETACPADWDLAGDLTLGAKLECPAGKLHMYADSTYDIFASLSAPTPGVTYSGVRIWARIAIKEWDGGRVMDVGFGNPSAFTLRAAMNIDRLPSLTLCDASEVCSAPFVAAIGEEHLYAFELTTSAIRGTVDCEPFGELGGVSLPTKDSVEIQFGDVDGDVIDGTVDDFVVSFF